MSAALRPDADAPCPHPPHEIHWYGLPDAKPGAPDCPSPGGWHLEHRGFCRLCRVPMIRRSPRVTFGPAAPVSGADPIPRRRYSGPGGGPYGRRHG